MQIVKYRHRVKGFLGGASDKNPACLGGASDKNPACQRRRQKRFLVRFLGGEDPLEVGTTIQSSVLAWSLAGRSLVGYSPEGHKELDTTKVT